MRVEFTLRRGDRCRDVVVHAQRPVPVGALRSEVARVTGIAVQASWWLGDSALTDLAEVGSDLRRGAVVDVDRPRHRRPTAGALALHQVGGPDAGRVLPLGRGRMTLGRDPGCDVVLADPDASRRHAVLDTTSAAITVHDLDSTNGTTVEGVRVGRTGAAVRPQDVLRLGDCSFVVATPSGAPASVSGSADGALHVLRPPRRPGAVAGDEVVVPSTPIRQRPRGVQWVAALVPAAAGIGIAWVTGSAQFLLFALLSPLMIVSTSLGDRLHWRRSSRREAAAYRHACAVAETAIATALTAETTARRSTAPDPAAVGRLAALPGSRLWERRPADADFLSVRIGTATLASSLQRREGAQVAAAGTVRDVPVPVDLRAGALAVAAPAGVLAGVGRWLVGQVAALHSPSDVEIVLLVSDEARWQWCRWLPHVRGRVATTPQQWARLVADLAADADRRAAVTRHHGDWPHAWRLLVVDRAAELAEVAGLAALLERGAGAGLAAICLDERASALPTACRAVVRAAGITGSRALLDVPGGPVGTDVVLDSVSQGWADDLARNLAPLLDAGNDAASIPDSCTLAAVLGLRRDDLATQITERWSRCDGGAATTPGRSADGAFAIDLASEGPHALIAGTTGAGKSELLRALVCGLAVDHPPDLLNFLLIDYKGGATFAEFDDLPHTAGIVTDLDSFLTARALRSLDSELRRRERLFADAGAVDLAAYRAAHHSDTGGDTVARLVIVVDEFATLADELPEFLRGLVGVAQRGRSLGVHLVLATQRPGSVITPEIRANTSVRIALRVTDPGESSDVVDAPDAAFIDRSTPGRAVLRSGTALIPFQTAHPGRCTPGADEVSVDLLDAWGRPVGSTTARSRASDLELIVEAIAAAHRHHPHRAARSPWLPPLPDRITRGALAAEAGAVDGSAFAPFGLVDLPDQQRRAVASLDARGSSLLVVGAARSGRTGSLAAIALSAAEQLGRGVHLYVVDATGSLAKGLTALPHCATVLGPAELQLTPTLLRRLNQRCTDPSAPPAHEDAACPKPVDLLLVDGWDSLTAAMSDADAVECTDLLTNLLRNGARAALTVVVAGGRACLAPRFAAAFDEKVLLRLSDANDYGMAGIGVRSVPSRVTPGRGVRVADAAEVQMLCATDPPGPDELARAVAALASARGSVPPIPGPGPIRLRPLPARVSLTDVAAPGPPGHVVLGLGGDECRPAVVDLFAGDARFLVSGPPRSGRTTALRSMLLQTVSAGIRVAVAAPTRSPLVPAARDAGVPVITPAAGGSQIDAALAGAEVVLVDDCEAFLDGAGTDTLVAAARASQGVVAYVVAGRNDDLASSYRGIGAHARRSNCGLLLRPGPVDGDLLGVRLARRPSSGPPGRGVLIGHRSTGPAVDTGEPLALQVAEPPTGGLPAVPAGAADGHTLPHPMCGYR